MTSFDDMVFGLGGVPLIGGLPFSGKSRAYFVDPLRGNDSNHGRTAANALASVAAAYAKTVDGQNDVVVFIGGANSDKPVAPIVWANTYTHLIGVSGPLSMGQRCRITNDASLDLATLFELRGSGCIVKNIQFFDGKDKNEDGACLLVSGDRNYLENVFAAGMGNATPGARAGSYSLKVSGQENRIVHTEIGLDTVVRAAANSELIVAGIRNRFERCVLRSYSVTAGKFMASVDNSSGDLRDTIFDDCLFYNYTPNWAAGITDAFHLPAAGSTYDVILRNCQLAGQISGWADTTTHIKGIGAQPNAGFGVPIAPTT